MFRGSTDIKVPAKRPKGYKAPKKDLRYSVFSVLINSNMPEDRLSVERFARILNLTIGHEVLARVITYFHPDGEEVPEGEPPSGEYLPDLTGEYSSKVYDARVSGSPEVGPENGIVHAHMRIVLVHQTNVHLNVPLIYDILGTMTNDEGEPLVGCFLNVFVDKKAAKYEAYSYKGLTVEEQFPWLKEK